MRSAEQTVAVAAWLVCEQARFHLERLSFCQRLFLVFFFSLYLFKLGLAPQIQDLYGKVDFTGERPSLFLRPTSLSAMCFRFLHGA